MTSTKHTQESEMLVILDFASSLVVNDPVSDWLCLKFLMLGPWQSVNPSLVTQPVTDEILVTSVNENRQLRLQHLDHTLVIRSHPITRKQKVSVDVEVTTLVLLDFDTQLFADLRQVQVVINILQLFVTQAGALALGSDIVDISSSFLVWTHLSVVTVDACWNTGPDRARVVTVLNQRGTSWNRGSHVVTFLWRQDRWLTTFTTSHWLVVLVLRQWVGQTVSNQYRFEVEGALWVAQDLRRKDWDVVASVGLACNVEVKFLVFWELLEEQFQERVHVFTGCYGVSDGLRGVRETNIDRLVQEDNRSVVVPRVWVELRFQVGVDRRRAQLKE